MSNPPDTVHFPLIRHRRQGVALVIVLAFVALLTGVLVAFLSRSVSDRQISNSSANETRTRLLADGAVDTLISDLKQEIAAGSASPAPTPAAGVTLYVPKAPATAVPALVGTAADAGTENLLKRSVRDRPFFAGANYDTANFPPPGNPSTPVATRSRAANVSSLTPSLNGRFVSPARWNKPLLLAKAAPESDTDLTPVGATPVTGNTAATWTNAPDWALVTRDGSVPTAWSTDLVAAPNKAKAVVGRYAYQVYDEGGLLDVNAAGVPSTPPLSTSPYANLVAYKGSLAFADLKQLPAVAALTASRRDDLLNALVGWRNYASAQPTNNFPGYAFSPAQAVNYLAFAGNHPKGFLAAGNTALHNGQSDRVFSGRQEFLKFLLSGFASQGASATAKTERANLQNALQHLTTFSRDLNQPSLTPAASRPKVKDIASGGNDAGDPAGSGTAENAVNPSFLTVRVPGTDPTKLAAGFKRSDGSPAMQTEPLIKERFALNRLAWVTYKGPSANQMSDSVIQQSITALGGDPTNSNDPVYLFVAQGTAQNIHNYFGLSWVRDNRATVGDGQSKWVYNHEGTAPVGAPSGSGQPIRSLAGSTNVAAKNREPDFFELLKAATPVGAIAKAYNYTAPASQSANYNNTPEGYNQQRDNSIDAAIIQMGANIIDQFDYDGYPARILFGDGRTFGGGLQEFRGVEDLPYLYRVREAKVMTRDSNPPQSDLPQAGGTIADPGQGVLLLQPEVWNPHAMQSASTTAPRPTNFRVLAATMDPLTETMTNYTVAVAWRQQVGLPNPQPPPVTTASASLNASVAFSIPTNRLDLFREPTLLAKPNVPSGSNLSGATYLLPTPLFTAAYQYGANGVTDDRQYTGIPLATVPMAFTTPMSKGGILDLPEPPNPGNLNPAPTNDLPPVATTGIAPTGYVTFPTVGHTSDPADAKTSFPYVTYRMQYQLGGGSWITYDEKYAGAPSASSFDTPGNDAPGTARFMYNKNKIFYRLQSNPWAVCAIGSQMAVMAFDPRSSRFGMVFCGPNGRSLMSFTLPLSSTVNNWEDNRNPWNRFGWAAPSTGTNPSAAKQMAVMTARPDENQGAVFSNGAGLAFGYDTGPTAGGWNPSGKGSVISSGLFTQNNPSISGSTLRYASDQQPPGTPPQYFADPDGVVRRATSAFVPTGTTAAAVAPASGPWGLPLKTAHQFDPNTGVATANSSNEHLSRPIVLNRPFRSVAELGHVFSGTPWRNLDFTTPESGAAGFLDAFCISANQATNNGLVAGRVNLNTRQIPVLQAILVGAYKDELNPAGSGLGAPMSTALAGSIATALVGRTATTAAAPQGPLTNVSELVGKWNNSVGAGGGTNGGKSYVGFTSDTVSPAPVPPKTMDLTGTLTSDTDKRIPRFRESAIRALTASGQTRVWNLMIDVVAQTGRYPQTATTLDKFNVEGEQRYWVHVAIDRYTGEVLDKQIEVVKE